tara:strand:- start:6226 stop:7698 length:1473 start_codon:yes stop_codon:yes gene_type:complete
MSATNQLPSVLQVSTIADVDTMNIKTEVLDPITITQTQAVFQIPKTGILDGGSMVQLGVTGSSDLFFPLNTGIHGLIKSCSLKVGGKVLASNDDYAHYTTMTRQFESPEHRAFVDMVKSGAIGDRFAEVESGRIGYRDLESTVNAGDATQTESLVPEFIRPTTDDSTTPLFSVPLSTLIPMMRSRTMPLMALKENVYIHITFNTQLVTADVGKICCIKQGSTASPAVTVSTSNIKFISDHLYYTDEKMDEVVQRSLSQDGLSVLYEDLITTFADVPALAPSAGTVTPQKIERQIAVSGRTVRNIMVAEKQLDHTSVILGDYISTDLIIPTSYNFRINDQRIYDRDVQAPPRKYTELAQPMGKPLMVPNQFYSFDADSDKQNQPTQGLNQNSVEIGKIEGHQLPPANGSDVTNDLRATSAYVGYDATTSGFNVLGNGVKVGVKPILIQKTYSRQADSGTSVMRQSGARQMRIYTGVERLYNIKNGEITISA